MRAPTLTLLALLLAALRPARADAEPQVAASSTAAVPLAIGGYVEAYYQWNFRDPSSGITAARGFDNRHDSLTLSNAQVEARWDDGRVFGRLALQVGATPSSYYLAEPSLAGAPGVNASDGALWKYLQEALLGYRLPVGRGLELSAGLYLSPIGPEQLAVRDDWSWSRSNLFFALPYYHAGLRATARLFEPWSLTLAVCNGWNSVVDANAQKSLSLQLSRAGPELSISLLYFGGMERPAGAPEGRPWRHLFDAHATWRVTRRLALLLHVDAGLEPGTFGVAAWGAVALYARLQVLEPLWIAVRGDFFRERVPSSAEGRARPIFWTVPWVSSQTLTVELRPREGLSLRLELRHDQAAAELYFGGAVQGDGRASPWRANRRAQDTLTLGAVAWF
jgi:hypothetical protein